MWSSSLMASLHYLAFGMALGGVFMRGRYLRAIILDATDEKNFYKLFIADNFWGLAALFLVITGVWRAFGGLEKGTAYYMQNTFFWIKMSVVILVIALEMVPMTRFVRWRLVLKRKSAPLNLRSLSMLRKINDTQLALTILLPLHCFRYGSRSAVLAITVSYSSSKYSRLDLF